MEKLEKLTNQLERKNMIRDRTLEIWKDCMDKNDCNNCKLNSLCVLLAKQCSRDYKEIVNLEFRIKEEIIYLVNKK